MQPLERFLKEKRGIPEKPDLSAFREEGNQARGRKARSTYFPRARPAPRETRRGGSSLQRQPPARRLQGLAFHQVFSRICEAAHLDPQVLT